MIVVTSRRQSPELAGHYLEQSTKARSATITDAASIVAGLGKVVLNGTMIELADATGEAQVLGYLDPVMKIDLYVAVNTLHRISENAATKHLPNAAIDLFTRHK